MTLYEVHSVYYDCFAHMDRMGLYQSYKTEKEAVRTARVLRRTQPGSVAVYKVTTEEIKF